MLICADPCGLAVDLLRAPYRVKMRGLTVSGEPIWVRWYERPEGTPFIGIYNRFSSLNWTKGQEGDTSIGEDPDSPRPFDGKPFAPKRQGKEPCGDLDSWTKGYVEGAKTFPVTRWGQSTCCLGLKGGLALGGGATDPRDTGVTIEVTGDVSADLVTVETPCCPTVELPTRLQARFVEVDEPCWNGVIIPLFWNGTAWVGTGTVGTCGYDLTLTFYCDSSGGPGAEVWVINAVASNGCVNGDGPTPFGGSSCDPFIQIFILGAGTWIGACSSAPVLAGWLQVERVP